MAKGSALRKQSNDAASAEFAALLDESLGGSSSFEGTVVKGTVVRIANDFVVVDVGLKSEGRVPMREFTDGGAAQCPGERGAPPDPTCAGVRLVIADQSQAAFGIVLVGDGDRRPEPDAGAILLSGGIDDLCRLHPARQPAQPPIDLAKALSPVDIVAVFGPVAIAGCPGNRLDQSRTLGREQLVIFAPQRGKACRRDIVRPVHPQRLLAS